MTNKTIKLGKYKKPLPLSLLEKHTGNAHGMIIIIFKEKECVNLAHGRINATQLSEAFGGIMKQRFNIDIQITVQEDKISYAT